MSKITRTCSECSAHFQTYPAWVRKGGGLTCSVACGRARRRRVALGREYDRFMRHVHPEPNSGCWLWTGPVMGGSYGAFRKLGAGTQNSYAHRYSFEAHCGPIPKGLFVCHRCDTPPCVNPDHLFLGTAADNNADKVRKGRVLRGEKVGNSKLTSIAVRAIRNDARSNARVAAEYGVSPSSVQSIRAGKVWKHVGGVIA